MISLLLQLEERNYSLLVFTNLQNREIEMLEKKTRDEKREHAETLQNEAEFLDKKDELLRDYRIQIQKSQK